MDGWMDGWVGWVIGWIFFNSEIRTPRHNVLNGASQYIKKKEWWTGGPKNRGMVGRWGGQAGTITRLSCRQLL